MIPKQQIEALRAVHVGLRNDLHFTRQNVRGHTRYVVHDPLTFKNHMFSFREYRIMAALSPAIPLEESFGRLVADQVFTEEDRERFYAFVVRLHGAHLLKLPLASADILFQRFQARQARSTRRLLTRLLYWKLPMLNPDRFLTRTVKWVDWLFSWGGMTLWALLMITVVWTLTPNFDHLVREIGGLLNVASLPIMWVVFVVLKVLHEFGHGYACKRFGGEVPEMGVALIVMTPCAYVDAGASWKFRHRTRRIVVGCAGMWVESFIAGFAALLWAGTQPGLLHDISLQIVLMASVTTFLGNANPLLRFDGYYILSDILGVINLSQRSQDRLKAFAKSTFLGLSSPEARYADARRPIYLLYGPAAFAYKLFLAFAITSLMLTMWLGPGLVIGGAFAWLLIVDPVRRLMVYLLKDEETRPLRRRARIVAAASVGVAILLFLFLPVSTTVTAPGVLEPGVRQSLRAPTNGFVVAEHVKYGATVEEGVLAYELQNPLITMRHLRLAGNLEAERIRFDVEELQDATKAATHKTRIGFLEAQVAHVTRRLDSMRMRTTVGGKAVSRTRTWLGRYVLAGEELCQVHSDLSFVRVVLTDEELARTRLEVGSRSLIQWTCDPSSYVPAVVSEIRRSASRNKVPVELTMLAGGEIHAKPVGEAETEADQPYLHVFFRAESVPIEGGVTGLTARVRIPARIQTLGEWVQQTLFWFYSSWKMS